MDGASESVPWRRYNLSLQIIDIANINMPLAVVMRSDSKAEKLVHD